MDGNRKDHIEWSNANPERQTMRVLSHLRLLASNFKMSIQYPLVTAEKEKYKETISRDRELE